MAKKNSNVVYSTLTSTQEYTSWGKNRSDVRVKGQSVRIEGGANVATKAFVTPKGVATFVNDDELAFLRENPVFKRHEERGFISVQEGADRAEVEKAISDLQSRDESAPLTEGDYLAEGKEPPKATTSRSLPPPPRQ